MNAELNGSMSIILKLYICMIIVYGCMVITYRSMITYGLPVISSASLLLAGSIGGSGYVSSRYFIISYESVIILSPNSSAGTEPDGLSFLYHSGLLVRSIRI